MEGRVGVPRVERGIQGTWYRDWVETGTGYIGGAVGTYMCIFG